MERKIWKLPHETYTMEVTSWERKPWKLPHGTY